MLRTIERAILSVILIAVAVGYFVPIGHLAGIVV